MDLWQQLTSSTPGLLNKRMRESTTAGGAVNTKKLQDPVDDFVTMEHELAGDLCSIIDISLSSLKKVRK